MLRDDPPHAWHLTEVHLLAGVGLTRFEVSDRVAERIACTPRFRQHAATTVGGQVWTDVADFEVPKHVRQLRLAAGASIADLQAMVGELSREPLTRSGPRWEIGVAARLQGNRCALLTRVNPAWIDGRDHVHLLQELIDDVPVAEPPVPVPWTPEPPPQEVATLVDAVRDPGSLLASVGMTLGRWGRQRLPLLRQEKGQPVTRDVAGTGFPLASVTRLAKARGCRVHDVLLAVLAGALRRTEERHDLVALVPQAVEPVGDAGALGLEVAACTIALPVEADDALDRLDQVASLTQVAVDSGRLVPALRMTELSGMASSTLHALAARTVGETPHEVFVANVPGPTHPRYLGERQVRATYPLYSLTGSQRYAVGFTSYCGQVYVGLTGAQPVDPLAAALVDELQELLTRTEA